MFNTLNYLYSYINWFWCFCSSFSCGVQGIWKNILKHNVIQSYTFSISQVSLKYSVCDLIPVIQCHQLTAVVYCHLRKKWEYARLACYRNKTRISSMAVCNIFTQYSLFFSRRQITVKKKTSPKPNCSKVNYNRKNVEFALYFDMYMYVQLTVMGLFKATAVHCIQHLSQSCSPVVCWRVWNIQYLYCYWTHFHSHQIQDLKTSSVSSVQHCYHLLLLVVGLWYLVCLVSLGLANRLKNIYILYMNNQ